MQAPAQSGRRWWGGRDGVGDAGSDGGDDGGGGGSSYSGDGITKTAEESPSIDKSYELQDGKVITVDNERFHTPLVTATVTAAAATATAAAAATVAAAAATTAVEAAAVSTTLFCAQCNASAVLVIDAAMEAVRTIP